MTLIVYDERGMIHTYESSPAINESTVLHTIIQEVPADKVVRRVDVSVVPHQLVLDEVPQVRTVIDEFNDRIRTFEARINELESQIIEINKKDDSEMPAGDYLNPIFIEINGQDTVEQGLFYYTTGVEKDMCAEAIQSGIPTGWNKDWFDIIEV